MCWPVLKPQMVGGTVPPGLVTIKVSTLQSPTPILSVATAPVATGVVRPLGGLSTIVSKSILSLQISVLLGQ